MAEYNPFQSELNPNMRQTGLFDLRMMSAANRAEQPFQRGSRYGSRPSMLSGLGGLPQSSSYDMFTYDPAMRAQAQAAGVQPLEASQVRQNMVLPNTGFFGRHQGLSNAIEGGIFGAAATRPSDTIGEGISNVAASMIEAPQVKRALWERQFAGPFQASDVLENLQDKQAMRAERGDRSQLLHTQMEYEMGRLQQLKNEPPPRYEQPINQNVAAFRVWDPKSQSYKTEENPYYDPKQAAAARVSWAGTEHLREYLEPMGVKDPDDATPEQWEKARKAEQADKQAAAAASQKPPQALGVDPKTNTYVRIGPGASGDVKPMSPLESGAHTAEVTRDKWIQSHMDKISAAHRALGSQWKPEYATDADARKKALSDIYERMGLGGAATDYVYSPAGHLVPTKPAD